MRFLIMILCKYTISEIEELVSTFKQELGEIEINENSVIYVVNQYFTASIDEDLEELEFDTNYFNEIFTTNLNIASFVQKAEEDKMINVYMQLHTTDDIYEDNAIKFVGEFMRKIEGDCFVMANDNVIILRHKDKTYVDTYEYEDDEFGYHFEKLRIDYIKKRLTD